MSKAVELANFFEEYALGGRDREAAAELRRLAAIEHEHRALLVNEQNLREELAALKATLAASCDEEREQLWEATPGGGCCRALDAERELAALKASLGYPVAEIIVSDDDFDMGLKDDFAFGRKRLPNGTHDLYALTNKDQS